MRTATTGEEETGRWGGTEIVFPDSDFDLVRELVLDLLAISLRVSVSPCLRVSVSPHLPVPVSPHLPISSYSP